jgi:hypothetical protein
MSAQAAAVASVVDLWPDGQLLDQHKITVPYWSINIRYPLDTYQKYQDNQRRSQEPSATNPSVGTNGFTGFLYL